MYRIVYLDEVLEDGIESLNQAVHKRQQWRTDIERYYIEIVEYKED